MQNSKNVLILRVRPNTLSLLLYFCGFVNMQEVHSMYIQPFEWEA